MGHMVFREVIGLGRVVSVSLGPCQRVQSGDELSWWLNLGSLPGRDVEFKRNKNWG